MIAKLILGSVCKADLSKSRVASGTYSSCEEFDMALALLPLACVVLSLPSLLE
jgi:hypothetical protein